MINFLRSPLIMLVMGFAIGILYTIDYWLLVGIALFLLIVLYGLRDRLEIEFNKLLKDLIYMKAGEKEEEGIYIRRKIAEPCKECGSRYKHKKTCSQYGKGMSNAKEKNSDQS